MKDITLQQIIEIVRGASALMTRNGFEIHDKGTLANLVTSSDIAVQHYLTENLSKLLPGCGFLCEEEDMTDTSHDDVWVIDPIDGTANYANGGENCCISVGLVRKGVHTAAVVYSPWRDELYSAEVGCGAFCNGKPIHVSGRSFGESFLFAGMSTYRKEFSATCRDIIYDLYQECSDFRRTGSSAVELCLLAAGKAELFFEINLMPWDYAGASLIVKEAGGTVVNFDGEFPGLLKAQPSIVMAGNTEEHAKRVLAAVRKHLDKLPY